MKVGTQKLVLAAATMALVSGPIAAAEYGTTSSAWDEFCSRSPALCEILRKTHHPPVPELKPLAEADQSS